MVCIVNKVACMCKCLRRADKLDPVWCGLWIVEGQQFDKQVAIPNQKLFYAGITVQQEPVRPGEYHHQ